MASEHRTTIRSVEQLVSSMGEQLHGGDFVAVTRALECASVAKPRVGDAIHVRDDVVRFSQHVSLAFQGRELHSLEAGKGAHAPRLSVNFLGLLGSNGPMPLHFSEYADQRDRHHSDPTFKEFLDLFNHRMVSLFYKAMVQFDPSVNFDRPQSNSYDEFLGALVGLLPEAAQHRDSLHDHAKRYFPGWYTDSSRSPDGISALVGDYFDLPVAVKEWVGGWLALPHDARARLGSGQSSVQLGRSLYIGKRVWSTRHQFHIQLGPLDWQTFNSFKPGSARAKVLHDLVRNYVGDEWEWNLELQLERTEVPSLRLNRRSALGFDSWLTGSAGGRRLKQQSVVLSRRQVGEPA